MKAHHIGIERAAFVLILETARLRRSSFAQELVEWAENVPMRSPMFITVEVEDGECIALTGPRIAMQQSTRRLVHSIDQKMQKFSNLVRPATSPVGSRGQYVLLSYASKDAGKVASIRQHLAQIGVEFWDYAMVPRDATLHYTDEIHAAIRKAKTVVIVLTAAWLKSDYCRGELNRARGSRRRCLWLRFGPGKPPVDWEEGNLIDFRGQNGKTNGFAQLTTVLSS
jgi:hypothetical protein